MSVQALGWVMDHTAARMADRLVLLSIANHASGDPDGEPMAWEAYPSIATIAREAGLAKPRTVTDCLTRLVETGQLVRLLNAAPDSRIPPDRRPNLYRIVMAAGRSCGLARCRWCSYGVPPHGTPAPVEKPRRGAAARRDGVPANGRQTVIEPLINPLRPAAPTDGVAVIVARAEWERLAAAGEPAPLCGFAALHARVAEALNAGHTPEAVGWALQGMRSYTRSAFDNALRGGGQLALAPEPAAIREACPRCCAYPQLLTSCPRGDGDCPAGLVAS